jgi:hypothetical protein
MVYLGRYGVLLTEAQRRENDARHTFNMYANRHLTKTPE